MGSSLIEVVGAGPAGLAAAITLARGGRQVVVHEAQHEVGHRFGADLQGLENWSSVTDVLDTLRNDGLTTAFEHLGCQNGVAFDPWDRRYELASTAPLVYLVERGPGPRSLDTALLEQALALGVEVRFGSRVQRLDSPGILATGPKRANALAIGYHFDTAMANGFWLILDDELAPQGYAYLLVMNGRGTIKSCLFSGFDRQRTYVALTVARFGRLVGLQMDNPRFHAGVGNIHLPASALSGAHSLVGECAGFQDGLAGFGMRYAMRSGVLAAHALLDGDDFDARWRHDLGGSLQAAVVSRAVYGMLGNRGYRWLLCAATHTGDARIFLRWLYHTGPVYRRLLPWARKRFRSRRDADANGERS